MKGSCGVAPRFWRTVPWRGCGGKVSDKEAPPISPLYNTRNSIPCIFILFLTISSDVREIRIKDATGAFRVVYVASFADAIYVLHALQKKTQRTALLDIELARSRFRQLAKELQS